MIIDKLLEFSHDQALLATAASDSSVDQGAAGSAMDGSQLWLVIRVGTALDSTEEDSTLDIDLQHDSATAFGSAVSAMAIKAIPEASLTANTVVWAAKLPKGLKRYLRVYFTVNTHNFTSGTIDAFLTPNVDELFV